MAGVYNDDPTIMSWQLANEPRPGVDGDSTHFDAFSKWIDDTSGFIKKLAPKQLVSTGNEGWMGTAGNRELYVKSHGSRARGLSDLPHVGAELAVVQPEGCRRHLRRRLDQDAGLSQLAHRHG